MTKFQPIKVTPGQGKTLAQTHAALWRGPKEYEPDAKRYGDGATAPKIMKALKDR